ncbi:MAG TPA: pyrroloquinoline-quinone synthase PqqC [Kofleriaceae bacterium]|nr:pyrroloquinoline-quinone synthase PqqC [Kofleriaceae bacterium]
MTTSLLSESSFMERLRDEGARRYHDEHPFHRRMHDGTLTRDDLQRWVENRYYYQTRIPIKDAFILTKSDDPAFRRMWIQRIHDHDGTDGGDGGAGDEGGLVRWQRLGDAVGLDRARLIACKSVLPGVRFACDAYVHFVRDASLVEAVASSLTEFFAPDLMVKRIAAWEKHYPWVERSGLDYFRSRVRQGRRDSEQAIGFVLEHARTAELQQRCIAALVRKTEILWHLLDSVQMAGASTGAS